MQKLSSQLVTQAWCSEAACGLRVTRLRRDDSGRLNQWNAATEEVELVLADTVHRCGITA
ncbi:hypothetical protein CH278_12845 [Rhodococcus sp. 05-2254-5]|nr:hypothetical protein CH278_12845 [Rhodococcus sp. 05-2254-5]OZE51028.1 hypothetical protein CH269_25790 [Rhodococcus sp. 05-2254-1]